MLPNNIHGNITPNVGNKKKDKSSDKTVKDLPLEKVSNSQENLTTLTSQKKSIDSNDDSGFGDFSEGIDTESVSGKGQKIAYKLRSLSLDNIHKNISTVSKYKFEEDRSNKEGIFGFQYWSDDDRYSSLISASNGNVFFDKNHQVPRDGKYMYAFSPENKFYIGTPVVHSQFLSGTPVISAGHLKIANGRITIIDNASGHYAPTEENFLAAMKIAAKKGFIGFYTVIKTHNGNKIDGNAVMPPIT